MADYHHGRVDTQKYNPNKVIVNYLPDALTDVELSSIFGTIGSLKSCNIVHDRLTGVSLGFGFVEYESEDDAVRAIETFNGLNLQQKSLKVAYARWPGTPETVGVNVHIRNLDPLVTVEEVEERFGQFGEIVRARVLKDQHTGISRGIAFILFANREDAERAVNTLNGVSVPRFAKGPLCVRFAIDKKVKAQALFTASTGLTGIAGFPVPHPLLQQAMSNVAVPPQMLLGSRYETEFGGGSIRQSHLKNRYNPMAGFGQVYGSLARAGISNSSTFANPAAGLLGLAAQGAMDYSSLVPRPGVLRQPRADSTCMDHPALSAAGYIIFVYNLEPDADERDLWQLFAPFGAVQKVDVIMDRVLNKCKGFGFVTMTRMDEAMQAISQLDGFVYKGRQLQVSLKTSSSKQGGKI